jgi:hypothetical protein
LSVPISEFSYSGILKINFLIIFVLLNIGLLYTEYLDIKYYSRHNTDKSILKAGLAPAEIRLLKNYGGYFVGALGLISSIITEMDKINPKVDLLEREQIAKEVIAQGKAGIRKLEKLANN